MNLEIIKSNVSDNFFCLFADREGRAALVDPIDGQQAVQRVERHGYDLTHLLNTHSHPDHVNGNPAVLDAFPDATVVAGKGDAEAIDSLFASDGQRGVDKTVTGGDVVRVGELALEVLDTPGHTPGHVSFLHEHHLFSGDTIFVGGAGNCRFGGDPGVLFRTFRDVLQALPPETVFYAGHDYAVRNAEFLLTIEPEHPETLSVLEEAKKARDAGRLMKTTLGRERAYNAFLRYDDPELQHVLESEYGDRLDEARRQADGDEEAVFRCVRSLRDEW